MTDLLSASTLLVTVLTILYALWYSEIQKATEREIKNRDDRNVDYKECRAIFLWKALPLFLGSAALVGINFQDSFGIVSYAFTQISATPRASYDAVKCTFVVVYCIMVFLTGHTPGSGDTFRLPRMEAESQTLTTLS